MMMMRYGGDQKISSQQLNFETISIKKYQTEVSSLPYLCVQFLICYAVSRKIRALLRHSPRNNVVISVATICPKTKVQRKIRFHQRNIQALFAGHIALSKRHHSFTLDKKTVVKWENCVFHLLRILEFQMPENTMQKLDNKSIIAQRKCHF